MPPKRIIEVHLSTAERLSAYTAAALDHKTAQPHAGMPQPARDAKEDSADYWLAQANKAVPGCDAKKTEAQLLEANLEKVREDAKKLEETRWLFEERPADPLSVEASVGL